MTSLLPIPAIDLLDGQCVRLRQGEFDSAQVYGADPVQMAAHWFALGAPRLHLVDLDGARSGEPKHLELVRQIRSQHPDKVIQIGGGLRSLASVAAYVELGVDYVILGTAAFKQPELLADACALYPDKVLVGIDARGDQLALEGWQQSAGGSALSFAAGLQRVGVSAIIYTDINQDGMLSGVNIAATQAIAEASGLPVIASGGIAGNADFEALRSKANAGIVGAIVGRALYEGSFDLVQALQSA